MRYEHIRRARTAKVAAKAFPVICVLLAVGLPIGAQAQRSTQVCPANVRHTHYWDGRRRETVALLP
jgi:hypothetical protein